MLAALNGDAGAYRRLLASVRTALSRYFARRLANAASAEDLVQDTLMAIHAKRMTFDRSQRVGPWVFAIARYRLIDHFRRQKLRTTVPLDEDLAIFANDDAADAADRLDVQSVLSTVPPRQRELLQRVKLGGESIADAAAATGMSETAAKVSIHRSMKSLTARFTGEDSDER